MRALAGLVLGLVAVAGCGSCAAQPSGTASGPAASPGAGAIAWPGRAAVMVREVEVGPWELRWVGTKGIGGLEAMGVESDLRDRAEVAGALGVEAASVDFEEYGSIVVRMPQGEVSRTARVAGRPAAAYEVLTADARAEGRYQLQRTWFVLYEPHGEAVGATAVLLPGMLGTPEPVIDGFVGRLRDRGWHVLRMLTHSSRFTEKRGYGLDPDDPTALAGEIAGEFGDRAAENALAVEAVCAHIAGASPGTPIGRRVAVGMSGGGMILPTVLARDPDAYAGAVYIGAGCDLAAITIESNYTDWINAVKIWWDAEPSAEAREAFTGAYRERAGLDSYSTAPAAAGIPTLMIHGELDQAVPAAYGDLLWRRLGEPERWSVAATHETLFLAYLPGKFDEVAAWMEGRGDP